MKYFQNSHVNFNSTEKNPFLGATFWPTLGDFLLRLTAVVFPDDLMRNFMQRGQYRGCIVFVYNYCKRSEVSVSERAEQALPD